MVLDLGAVPQCNFPAGLLLTDCLCSPNGPPSVLHLVVQDQVQSRHHCSVKQPTMFHIVPLICVFFIARYVVSYWDTSIVTSAAPPGWFPHTWRGQAPLTCRNEAEQKEETVALASTIGPLQDHI